METIIIIVVDLTLRNEAAEMKRLYTLLCMQENVSSKSLRRGVLSLREVLFVFLPFFTSPRPQVIVGTGSGSIGQNGGGGALAPPSEKNR